MNANYILGFTLIFLSVLFFGVFIWWGTTPYNPSYAFGIILVAIGTFIAGILSLYNPFESLYGSNQANENTGNEADNV